MEDFTPESESKERRTVGFEEGDDQDKQLRGEVASERGDAGRNEAHGGLSVCWSERRQTRTLSLEELMVEDGPKRTRC